MADLSLATIAAHCAEHSSAKLHLVTSQTVPAIFYLSIRQANAVLLYCVTSISSANSRRCLYLRYDILDRHEATQI